MLEIFFVIGFFIMLMVTGVSLLGVIASLFAASLFMLIGGLFAVAIKVLPWLLLAAAAVWMWRRWQRKTPYNAHRSAYRKRRNNVW